MMSVEKRNHSRTVGGEMVNSDSESELFQSPQPTNVLKPVPKRDIISPNDVAITSKTDVASGVVNSEKLRTADGTVPDGGYGWVIVCGAAFTHFLLVGMARSLGVLYLILLDRYEGSATATAWVLSAFNATRTLAGPICSKLVDKFGGRALAMVGSVVLCIGLVVSAFAMNLWYLYATFGALAGMGGAMVFVPAYIMVGKYFDKHKGKAMAFATIGSGLGNVFFAPAISKLFDFYGYFGALLVLGACQLNHAIAGSLYRPLPPVKIIHCAETEMKTITINKPDAKCTLDEEDSLTGKETQEVRVYENSTGTNSFVDKSSNTRQSYAKSSNSSSGCCSRTSLAKNVTFYVYGYLIMSMQTCIMTFLIFLPDYCTELGVDRDTAAWVLTIFGFSDMAGRFFFGFLFDVPRIRQRRRDFYCFVSGMFGLCVFSMCFVSNFIGVCVLTSITAIFEGATHSQRATVVSEFVLPEQMSTAVGIIIFCQGLGNLYGPPLAGLFKDITGTSKYGFMYCGSLMFTASLLFFAEGFFCKKCRQQRWKYANVPQVH